MIPKPTVKDLARDAERDKSRADELNKDGYFSQYIAVIALAWIARAVAAERERDELRAESERLKSEIVGHKKANDLLLKGMESQAELMDGMKQELRTKK